MAEPRRAPKEHVLVGQTTIASGTADRGVSAEEIVEVAVFWILRLLGRRFQGMYSPKDVAIALAHGFY